MGSLRTVLLVTLLCLPAAAAQADPNPVSEVINDALGTSGGAAEDATGEDLSTEQIDLMLKLDIVNAEFDPMGILFGGGKVQTDLEAHAQLAFYAANVSHAEDALAQAAGDEDATLKDTAGVDTNQTVVTAEMIRTAGGGILLEAFQSMQEDAAQRYVETTLPQVTVLSTTFTWSNTEPAEDAEGIEDEEDVEDADAREPPIVLDAKMTLRFLDRIALGDLLEDIGDDEDDQHAARLAQGEHDADEDDRVKEAIQQAHTPPLLQQDAFQMLGVDQLLDLDLPPGWRLNLTLTVPEGYTIEGSSDALIVDDDRETLTYFVDGSQRETEHQTTGMASLSSRSLVTQTLALLVGIAGILARYPIEMVAFAAHDRFL